MAAVPSATDIPPEASTKAAATKNNTAKVQQLQQKKKQPLYHERQRLALCAVHAVNNILQKPHFTKADFDALCRKLDPNSTFWNAHRSPLPIGNYDVNVIQQALQNLDWHVHWHDRRVRLETALVEKKKRLAAILWNVPATSWWGKLTHGRHWIGLLRVDDDNDKNNASTNNDGEWWDLDSNLSQPRLIGDTAATCAAWIEGHAQYNDSHVLLVERKTMM